MAILDDRQIKKYIYDHFEKIYDLRDYGIWEVFSFHDSNNKFDRIGIYTGIFMDILEYALDHNRDTFTTNDGRFGRIEKIEGSNVEGDTLYKKKELMKKKALIEDELEKVDTKLKELEN